MININASLLSSPFDKSALKLISDNLLIDKSGNEFVIKNGIARFVDPDNYANAFGKQWNFFRETQLDKFNKTTITTDRFFEDTKWTKAELKGKRILEVGSGAGRFTSVLLGLGCEVHSIDYSNAVEANYGNNGPHKNLFLYQADIYHLPFKDETFDYVFCFGVLQHTPDVYLSFKSLIRFLKKSGKIAVDVYPLEFRTLLMPKYYYRSITKRINTDILFKFIHWYVPKVFPISSFLIKTKIFRYISGVIFPIANYTNQLPLNTKQLMEWSILDTFDMLSPAYDKPQRLSVLRKWFLKNNLQIIHLGNGVNGYVAMGKKI